MQPAQDETPYPGHPIIVELLIQKELSPYLRRRAALLLSGKTQVGLAKQLKVTRVALYNTLTGRNRSSLVELAVAEAIKVPRQLVWPEWHDDRAVLEALDDWSRTTSRWKLVRVEEYLKELGDRVIAEEEELR